MNLDDDMTVTLGEVYRGLRKVEGEVARLRREIEKLSVSVCINRSRLSWLDRTIYGGAAATLGAVSSVTFELFRGG